MWTFDACLSDLADIEEISAELKMPKAQECVIPEIDLDTEYPHYDRDNSMVNDRRGFTGETKPGTTGGPWHKTALGSWHLVF